MPERLQCDTCPVRDRAACAALAPAERRELAELGHRRRVPKGATLFAAGAPNDRCATLVRGVLKITDFGADGTERIVSLIHPAGFVGELFAPSESHDIVALTDCELCVFGQAEYDQAIDRFPALAKALLRRSSEDLLDARNRLSLQSRRDSRTRVASLLMSLAGAASHSPCHPAARFDLPMSRGEIAALTGMTIETLSRQLTALERAGVIRRDGARGIEILDAPGLEREAG